MFNFIIGSVEFREGVTSGCCNEKVYLNTDICSRCKEHSDLIKDNKIITGLEQLDSVLAGGIPKEQFMVLTGIKQIEGVI